jgi:hypothetical protein
MGDSIPSSSTPPDNITRAMRRSVSTQIGAGLSGPARRTVSTTSPVASFTELLLWDALSRATYAQRVVRGTHPVAPGPP